MSIETLNIRPVDGRRVTMPESGEILTRPISVQPSPFWLRRLADGDVERDTPQAAPPAPSPAPANRKKEG